MFIAQENDFAPPIRRACCWDAAPWPSTQAFLLLDTLFS
jgi:hypothetical protein